MHPAATFDLGRIAQDLQIRKVQVEHVVALLDEGNTVPFITRYRKERTGGLKEDVIRMIQKRIGQLRQLAERRQTILKSIEGQGKLTEELRSAILGAETSRRLEDLYLPFKPKKRSLAAVARERGLEPLAQALWGRDPAVANLNDVLPGMVNPEKELATPDDVLTGARHILAEQIADTAEIRAIVRAILWDTGKLTAGKNETTAEGQGLDYKDYFQYSEPVHHVPPHRILAINRGEKENILKVRLEWNAEAVQRAVLDRLPLAEHPHADFLKTVADDALARLLLPSLEREIRRELTEEAENHAISVFGLNLRSLLLQPPLHGRRVLALDPGFRTGCKLVALDEYGSLLDEGVIFPHAPQNKKEEARAKLEELARKHRIQVIAIGNGTACRETEELVSEVIAALSGNVEREAPSAEQGEPGLLSPAETPTAEQGEPGLLSPAETPTAERETQSKVKLDVSYIIVNEAGASVYSTSTVGREEFPNHDATLRSAISIGRRLQDPLSELVKIEPQHIGVGLYQHDLHTRHLKESLEAVVESAVNHVGVDLNTASVPLLRYVAGFNQVVAREVVEYRKQHGPFKSREQILQVSGVGPARYVQAAGFLKIFHGDNPLDRTWIHPESYPIAQRLIEEIGLTPAALEDREQNEVLREKLQALSPEEVAQRLEAGVPTVRDILDSLARPGRDPREDLPPPIFKKGVLKLEDLQPGMELKGTVLNVVDFGAFVDIGLKDSGLVHISQMANRYIKNPYEVVAVGDVVTVWVLTVDQERKRVSLTMIKPGTERTKPPEKKPPMPRTERHGRPPRRRHPAAAAQTPSLSQSGPGTSEAVATSAASQTPPQPAAASAPPAGRPSQPPRKPYRKPPQPKKLPKLSQEALEGKSSLRTFGELAAFFAAKDVEDPSAQGK